MQKIGELKGGGVVYRPEREAEVLRRIQSLNPVIYLMRQLLACFVKS